jgi:hypothetical protein
MLMMNPKAWETINSLTANVKAATKWLDELGVHFPENKPQLTDAAARIEAECNATIKSLLTEALNGVDAKVDRTEDKAVSMPAKLIIEEAAGKRIRRLCMGEMYAKSRQIYLGIEFDDDTEIAIDIDVASRLSFAIDHLSRHESGDMEPVKERIQGSLRSLVKQSGQ